MATAVSTTALLDSFSFQSSDDESERKKSIPQSRKRKKKRKRQSTGGAASRKTTSRDIRTLKPAWNYSGTTTSSAMSTTSETTHQLLGFNVKRVELSSKPSNQMTRCASQQATWSASTKLPSVQQTRASSVFSTNQTGPFQEKKKRKVALLVAIKPENVESEKARFFRASYNYHPLFIYKYPADPEVLARTSNPSDRYLTQAVHIMETAIAKYGSYETFEEKTGGKPMSRTQIMAMVLQYLRKENLEEEISVNMSEVLMSRASMTNVKGKPTLNVRVWNLREHWVDGLLRHEVGTHYIRSYNNQFQPWYNWKKRKELDMEPINPTEEGLAALHSILVRKDPSLWRAAILYYTTYWAAHMSLRDLFKDLGRFVQDPHTRWDYCMRTKRGQTDTSQPGGFCKDQVYLTGALELLRYRHSIDFHALARLGKVSYKDVDKLKNIGDFEETRIPYFMQDTNWYLGRLDHIVRANGLTDAELKRVVPDLDVINLESCGSASSFNYF